MISQHEERQVCHKHPRPARTSILYQTVYKAKKSFTLKPPRRRSRTRATHSHPRPPLQLRLSIHIPLIRHRNLLRLLNPRLTQNTLVTTIVLSVRQCYCLTGIVIVRIGLVGAIVVAAAAAVLAGGIVVS